MPTGTLLGPLVIDMQTGTELCLGRGPTLSDNGPLTLKDELPPKGRIPFLIQAGGVDGENGLSLDR